MESPDGSVRSHLGPVSAEFESFKVTGLGLAVESLQRGDVADAVQIVTSLVSQSHQSTGVMNSRHDVLYSTYVFALNEVCNGLVVEDLLHVCNVLHRNV